MRGLSKKKLLMEINGNERFLQKEKLLNNVIFLLIYVSFCIKQCNNVTFVTC